VAEIEATAEAEVAEDDGDNEEAGASKATEVKVLSLVTLRVDGCFGICVCTVRGKHGVMLPVSCTGMISGEGL
jgi:hypothetical protein